MTKLRCAIYTRKSSEEGLEQDFNSLHAQREACEAYIRSQKHEGWNLIPTAYDDGGISGGTMERPGLKSLLSDIAMGKIDIVVVYKVDSLTRALADFAKMVELFDKHNVSFVSVTQQFNTTTSMGRLTLNVLLSFAQFEREVTGERIRDKIAASKKKGMWMGGAVPLGYKAEDRALLPNLEEIPKVQHLFERYVALGSVMALRTELREQGIVTRSGRQFDRGMLYHMLSNPIYIGKAQEGWRIPATTIEPLIASMVITMLADASAVQQACQDAGVPHEQWQRIICTAKEQGQRLAKSQASAEVFAWVEWAVLHTDSITLTLDLTTLLSASGIIMKHESIAQLKLTQSVPMQMKRRGVEMRLVIPSADAMLSKPDPTLIRAIARAHYWFEELCRGRASTLKELAQRENIGPSYIGDALKLAFLAPDIIEKILAGQQPASLTTFHLLRRVDLPIVWDAQRAALGF